MGVAKNLGTKVLGLSRAPILIINCNGGFCCIPSKVP
ncbi:hypothetical protein Ptr902_06487 [Pyrenophora tritici-repentis]|nr:hypothetical protein Ptr902_06487 [Pyrenophora tritici-repentis]